jgi:hypothetical protein
VEFPAVDIIGNLLIGVHKGILFEKSSIKESGSLLGMRSLGVAWCFINTLQRREHSPLKSPQNVCVFLCVAYIFKSRDLQEVFDE